MQNVLDSEDEPSAPRRSAPRPPFDGGSEAWQVVQVIEPSAPRDQPGGIETAEEGTTFTGWLVTPGPVRDRPVDSVGRANELAIAMIGSASPS